MAELDARVLAFTMLVSLAAPLAFGLLPALRASTSGPSAALRDGRSGDGGRSGKRARGFLVTAQVSLALTLMIVASLLTRSVVNMQTRPLRFDHAGLLTVELNLPEARYEDPEARRRFFRAVREQVASFPGMAGAELTSVIPGADLGMRRSLVIEGVDVPEGRAPPGALFTTVSPGYFDMIGLSMVSGRGFVGVVGPDTPDVAIVSREIAGDLWPNDDPLGRRFQIAGTDGWIEVVGVVADVRSTAASERPERAIYRPHEQDAASWMYVVSRVAVEPAALAGPIRQSIWSIDPDQPIDDIRTMARAHYESSASDYALLTLFVTFAVFALVMAAIGIYGVMAYAVSQRRAEIGLRMALGAEVSSVRWMILSQGVRLLGLGIAIGIVAAFLMSRLLGNLVFGISATDPATFVGVPMVLAAVALFANLLPARRATRLDPANTLRVE